MLGSTNGAMLKPYEAKMITKILVFIHVFVKLVYENAVFPVPGETLSKSITHSKQRVMLFIVNGL